MDPDALRDDQWDRIMPLVPGGRKGKRGQRSNNRHFIDALLWMVRSGSRWRDLPERFGPIRRSSDGITAGSRWLGPAGALWRRPGDL